MSVETEMWGIVMLDIRSIGTELGQRRVREVSDHNIQAEGSKEFGRARPGLSICSGEMANRQD
jgi:hypothetical protein